MKLEDHVRWCIWTYPTLYRGRDYASSRILVLNHLFFTIGTGLEWHRDGYLTDGHKNHFRKTLPKRYFECNLYCFLLDESRSNKKKVKQDLNGAFHYFLGKRGKETEVVFEATPEEAKRLTKAHGRDPFATNINHPEDDFPLRVRNAAAMYLEQNRAFGLNPYPLSEYSSLVEITKGRTNSLHVENFDLVPQPDWLEGCADMARYALSYYQDEEKYKHNSYHPDQTLNQFQWEIKDAKREGRKPHFEKNMKEGETLEEFAQRIWDRHLKDELKLLDAFFAKYETLHGRTECSQVH